MRARETAFRLLSIGVCAVLFMASFKILFYAHVWVWPRFAGPNVTVMGATGYSMGGPLVFSALAAIPASFMPGFKSVPGRYFFAWGVLLLCLSALNAFRVYTTVSGATSPG